MRFRGLVGLTFVLVLGCGTSTESDNGVAGGAAGEGSGGAAGTPSASGEGGSSEGGAGGGESSAGQSSGGSGSNEDCREVQCLRPYECVTECGSDDIFNNGCCPCPEGRIDVLSCRGAGGEGGSGTSGAAGQAGAGSESAGASGSSNEDVTRGGASSGGAGGHEDCREVQCFRPYECVTECGSDDILNNGCCPCPEGRIDILACRGAGSD